MLWFITRLVFEFLGEKKINVAKPSWYSAIFTDCNLTMLPFSSMPSWGMCLLELSRLSHSWVTDVLTVGAGCCPNSWNSGWMLVQQPAGDCGGKRVQAKVSTFRAADTIYNYLHVTRWLQLSNEFSPHDGAKLDGGQCFPECRVLPFMAVQTISNVQEMPLKASQSYQTCFCVHFVAWSLTKFVQCFLLAYET